jgi:hypothetical protein
MNGFKASKITNNLDHHTFLAPSNVVVPKTVGRLFSIELIVI